MVENKPTLNILPLLTILLIVAAFLIGSMSTKIKFLEKGTVAGATQPQIAALPPANPQAPPANNKVENVEKLRNDDHVRGNRNARILLIEYSDLECPFCKSFHPTAQKVVDDYKGQVAWVYRHFPLDQIHPKADKEAEAIECAGELGGDDAFWKMTDKIFEVTPSNNGLNLDELPKLASAIGLKETAFKACLDSAKYAKRVESDYQSGVNAGIRGTPGNILLDTKSGKVKEVPGAVPFDQVKPLIDELLTNS